MLGRREVAKRNDAQAAVLERSNVTGSVRIVLLATVWPRALPFGVHHIESRSIRREIHGGGIPAHRNLLDEFHRLDIHYADGIDARLGHVQAAVARHNSAGHDAAQRPALAVLKTLSGK